MSETSRAFNFFSPLRFGILLAVLICATFPQVIAGWETFVARDYGFFAYPLAHFQRDCFWRGEIPFWDPYNNCGVPFLAQWNTMALYPPALIYLLLPLPWSLGFFSLLHLWFGGMGMYWLARRWTKNDFAAAFAGTVFAFNGLTLNLLTWPSHTATFAWMPWVVLAVELAWRDGGRKIILAAIAGAMQMLAGGPEIIFLTWILLLALWLQQLIFGDATPRGKMFRRFPLIAGLVFLLSAAQLLPFLDLAAHSQRQTGFADFRWSMPGWGWVNFLVPMAFGGTWNAGIFFQYGQAWTSSYYLGLGALWLALMAFWLRDRRARLLLALAVIAFLFAMGGNFFLLPALRKILPQLSFVTYPVKYILLTVFVAPLLAALALAQWQNPKMQKRFPLVGTILFLLIGGISFWAWRFPSPTDDVHATLLNGLSRAVFLVIVGAILFVMARKSESKISRVTPLILILTAWLDVFTHEPVQNPTVAPTVYQPNLAREDLQMNPQPGLGGSRAMLSPAAAMRFLYASGDPKNNFLAKRAGYCANANLLDDVSKVDGFFSLTPRESDDVLSLFYTTTNASYPGLEDFLSVSQITAPGELFQWQPRPNFLPLVTAGQKPIFLDDAKTLPALTQNDFDGNKVVFLSPEDQSFVVVSNQTNAKILDSKFGDNAVDANVEATAPSLVVVAQTFYHDWRVEIDGQPAKLLRANFAFQAVEVPEGTHHLHFFYEDRPFEAGAAASIVTWMGCLICLLRLPVKKN